jgi:hypothetical protein
MPIHETAANTPMPWFRRIAVVAGWFLLWPTVLIVVPLLLVVGLYAAIHLVVSELRFRVRMRRCGRFLCRRDFSARVAAEGSDTLIVESPTPGWRITHAWWTPEKVSAICPYSVPSEDDYRRAADKAQCLDWDRWHWDNFTDPNQGRAFLLRVWNGRSLERWMKRTFPGVDVVNTWTALVHAQNQDEPG